MFENKMAAEKFHDKVIEKPNVLDRDSVLATE